MPVTSSAKKSLRRDTRKHSLNTKKKVEIRKAVKAYDALLKSDKKAASKQLSTVFKHLDKAAKSNLIKKNKANRTKSRLSKKLAQD